MVASERFRTKCSSIIRPTRLFLAAALLAGCLYPSTQSTSYQSYEYLQINQPLTSEDYVKYKPNLEPYLDKININNVRTLKKRTLVVIRLDQEEFCEQDFCLTIITTQCGKNHCPSTSIIAANRFTVEIQMLQRLGDVLKFPTRLDNHYTAVLVNDRYVAAAQGI